MPRTIERHLGKHYQVVPNKDGYDAQFCNYGLYSSTVVGRPKTSIEEEDYKETRKQTIEHCKGQIDYYRSQVERFSRILGKLENGEFNFENLTEVKGNRTKTVEIR